VLFEEEGATTKIELSSIWIFNHCLFLFYNNQEYLPKMNASSPAFAQSQDIVIPVGPLCPSTTGI